MQILELNNIDIYGRRFNGYNLQQYITQNSTVGTINFLVNHKIDKKDVAKKLYANAILEEYDNKIELAEKNILRVKNQISIAEEALKRSEYYKRADVVHFHMYHNMNLPIEFLSRIEPSKKIIIDIHDTYWLTDSRIPMLSAFSFTDRNSKSLNAQRKRVLNDIDADFVVHSPYILDLFKKSSITKNQKNVHLINFGIDTNVFKPMTETNCIRAKLHIPKDNIVLFCRAQNEFKGTQYIREALDAIKDSSKITVITVNEKGLLSSLESKMQVIDFGMVKDDSKMIELYNVCDIFLSPSTEESFGFMAIEAMACGKPVIVFDGTALPDTTQAPEIGFLCKRNSDSLRSAIEYLISNKAERISRGKAGLKHVKKNYSLKQYYDGYINLFKKSYNRTRCPIIHQKRKLTTDDTLVKFKRELQKIESTVLSMDFDGGISRQEMTDELFDYNDLDIQQTIADFNKNLFTIIKKHNSRDRIVCLIKRAIPKPIKNTIKHIAGKV